MTTSYSSRLATINTTRYGQVLSTPGEPGYDEACAAYNLAFPLRPSAAVLARTTDDVVAAVQAPRRTGLDVRVQSTGHGASNQGPLDRSVLVRTAFDAPVLVDPVARTARIPAGTTWQAVVTAAAPYGLVALHGSSPTVGAVGYLLGGGMSFYGPPLRAGRQPRPVDHHRPRGRAPGRD